MRREETIALIRGLRQAHEHAFKRKPRRGKIPAPVRPAAIQAEYLKGIIYAAIEPASAAVDNSLVPALQGLVEEAARERGDSTIPYVLDASSERARGVVERIAEQVLRDVSPAQLENLARRIAGRASEHQKEQLRRQVRAAVGVDPIQQEPKRLGALVDAFVHENVALVRSIPRDLLGDLEKVVARGVRSGQRHEEIAKVIEERFDVAENRAALIARDQVGKFIGELNKARQEALGIEGYVWRTVGDNRVRDEHDEREGESFSWDDPPEDGHPGEAVNCRCWPEPDLSSILEAL